MAESTDLKNYLYAKRKEQLIRLVLDGDWSAIRRVLDHMDEERRQA